MKKSPHRIRNAGFSFALMDKRRRRDGRGTPLVILLELADALFELFEPLEDLVELRADVAAA